MDSIRTHPMALDNAAEFGARRVASRTDEGFRPWSDTMPAADPPDATLRAASTPARSLPLLVLAAGLFGLVAYALRRVFQG